MLLVDALRVRSLGLEFPPSSDSNPESIASVKNPGSKISVQNEMKHFHLHNCIVRDDKDFH